MFSEMVAFTFTMLTWEVAPLMYLGILKLTLIGRQK